jgi:hypothetical protein
MGILTLLMPDNTQSVLNVAAGTLVFNGSHFVQPDAASHVELFTVPSNAEIRFGVSLETVMTAGFINAKVLSFNNINVNVTDSSIVSEPDPSNGQVVAGVTSRGTWLEYVQVNIQTS